MVDGDSQNGGGWKLFSSGNTTKALLHLQFSNCRTLVTDEENDLSVEVLGPAEPFTHQLSAQKRGGL